MGPAKWFSWISFLRQLYSLKRAEGEELWRGKKRERERDVHYVLLHLSFNNVGMNKYHHFHIRSFFSDRFHSPLKARIPIQSTWIPFQMIPFCIDSLQTIQMQRLTQLQSEYLEIVRNRFVTVGGDACYYFHLQFKKLLRWRLINREIVTWLT